MSEEPVLRIDAKQLDNLAANPATSSLKWHQLIVTSLKNKLNDCEKHRDRQDQQLKDLERQLHVEKREHRITTEKLSRLLKKRRETFHDTFKSLDDGEQNISKMQQTIAMLQIELQAQRERNKVLLAKMHEDEGDVVALPKAVVEPRVELSNEHVAKKLKCDLSMRRSISVPSALLSNSHSQSLSFQHDVLPRNYIEGASSLPGTSVPRTMVKTVVN